MIPIQPLIHSNPAAQSTAVCRELLELFVPPLGAARETHANAPLQGTAKKVAFNRNSALTFDSLLQL